MIDLRTLNDLEKEIASLIQVAEADEARARFHSEELPASLADEDLALVFQGFDAGYMRACRRVLSAITEMKANAK